MAIAAYVLKYVFCMYDMAGTGRKVVQENNVRSLITIKEFQTLSGNMRLFHSIAHVCFIDISSVLFAAFE